MPETTKRKAASSRKGTALSQSSLPAMVIKDIVASVTHELTSVVLPELTSRMKQDIVSAVNASPLFRINGQPGPTAGAPGAAVNTGLPGSAATNFQNFPATPGLPNVSMGNMQSQGIPSLGLGMLALHTSCSPMDEGHLQAPPDLFVSRSLPIDMHVSYDIRAKIVSHKYIDLDALVPKANVSPPHS
jgi:hypothetical protein